MCLPACLPACLLTLSLHALLPWPSLAPQAEPTSSAEPAAAAAAGSKRKREPDFPGGAFVLPAGPGPGLGPALALAGGSPGFVQGPVVPFRSLDVSPDEAAAAGESAAVLAERCELWLERGAAALAQGGPMAEELDEMVAEGEQYVWGGEGMAPARALQPRLVAAAAFMEGIRTALRVKPTMEAAEALLGADPKPVANPPGLPKLAEAVKAGRDWVAKSADVLSEAVPCEVRTLEAAVNEASRLPGARAAGRRLGGSWDGRPYGWLWVGWQMGILSSWAAPAAARCREVSQTNLLPRPAVVLSELRSLRERLASARRIGDAIRTALPSAREVGRRNKKGAAGGPGAVEGGGEGQVGLETLRALRAQAAAARVDMPEVHNLTAVLERLEVWQARVRALGGMRAPLAELQELREEADSLPAVGAELDSIRVRRGRVERVGLVVLREAREQESGGLCGTRRPSKEGFGSSASEA